MSSNLINNDEMNVLLEVVKQTSGYDFRDYSSRTLKRRLGYVQRSAGLEHLLDMVPLVKKDEKFRNRLLKSLSITVTNLFRDPSFFLSLRKKVLPLLAKKRPLKIWHAGCATGEEVYSLAIIIQEVLGQIPILTYATDINNKSLAHAHKGVFSIPVVQEGTSAYWASGGTGSLSNYCHCQYGSVKMNPSLGEKVNFSHFDLATDSPFGKVDLILCRNVMIYFNDHLQEKVLDLLTQSLNPGGILCLGAKETLKFPKVIPKYYEVDALEKIYGLKRASCSTTEKHQVMAVN